MKTLSQLIKDGKYDWKYIEDGAEQSLLPIKKLQTNLALVPLGEIKTTQQIWDEYGDKLAHPLELFIYAAKYPDEQRNNPIITIWKDKVGQFWCAFLSGVGSDRLADVNQGGPGNEVFGYCRVLVRESGTRKLSTSGSLTLSPSEILDNMEKEIKTLRKSIAQRL